MIPLWTDMEVDKRGDGNQAHFLLSTLLDSFLVHNFLVHSFLVHKLGESQWKPSRIKMIHRAQ